MEQIRAFVGDSFTQDEEQVVQKVLKFLTTVSHTLPDFVWEHAQVWPRCPRTPTA